MPLVSDAAICLRKHEYSETSQVLSLLTRDHGLIRAMAKGAHRRTKAGASRFDGGIDLLDLGQGVLSADTSRDLALLTDWKLQDGHLGLRKNLRSVYLGIYSVELVEMLLEEHDPHAEIFDMLRGVLAELQTENMEERFLAFQLDLLRNAGFMPEFGSCVNCHSAIADRQDVHFSPSRGGVVCGNCQGSFPDRIALDVRLLRLVRMMQGTGVIRRLPRLTRHQTDPLNRLLLEHIENALGRRPRSADYILGKRQAAMAGTASRTPVVR